MVFRSRENNCGTGFSEMRARESGNHDISGFQCSPGSDASKRLSDSFRASQMSSSVHWSDQWIGLPCASSANREVHCKI